MLSLDVKKDLTYFQSHHKETKKFLKCRGGDFSPESEGPRFKGERVRRPRPPAPSASNYGRTVGGGWDPPPSLQRITPRKNKSGTKTRRGTSTRLQIECAPREIRVEHDPHATGTRGSYLQRKCPDDRSGDKRFYEYYLFNCCYTKYLLGPRCDSLEIEYSKAIKVLRYCSCFWLNWVLYWSLNIRGTTLLLHCKHTVEMWAFYWHTFHKYIP